MKGASAVDAGDAEQLPAPGDGPAQRLQEGDVFPMKVLRQAQGEGVGHVEGGRPFFRMGVKGILGSGLGDRACTSGDESPNHGTGFVERL